MSEDEKDFISQFIAKIDPSSTPFVAMAKAEGRSVPATESRLTRLIDVLLAANHVRRLSEVELRAALDDIVQEVRHECAEELAYGDRLKGRKGCPRQSGR